jgi:mono/diheme cytochrome c family protein
MSIGAKEEGRWMETDFTRMLTFHAAPATINRPAGPDTQKRGEALKRKLLRRCAIAAVAVLPWMAQAADSGKAPGERQLERGRYVVMTGGCNDCHTAGYGPREGKVPQSEWLLGSGALGYRGPWGTTYAPNLRLIASKMSEDDWVKYGKALKTRPPMPFFNVNAMRERDLRAMYRFIRSLGPVGEPAQAYLPPDKEPKPPYIQWPAPPK